MGDDTTARLAASIRADEERMLARVLREIPKLTEAVVGADVRGEPSYRVAETGAADAVRETAASAKRTARQARKVPGVARAEGQVKGAVASEQDLAISRYDSLTADEIVGRLAGLSQVDLAKVAAYERKHQNRSTVLGRIDTLQGDEPWPGYDELTADEVRAVLSEGDDDRARRGPRLRARAQEPRRRAQGRRARGGHRLAARAGSAPSARSRARDGLCEQAHRSPGPGRV